MELLAELQFGSARRLPMFLQTEAAECGLASLGMIACFHGHRIDLAGQPLLRNDLPLGPAWPGSDGPAGAGPARAVGTLVLVGAGVAPSEPVIPIDGVRVGRCDLAPDAVLVTALGDRPSLVRRALDAVR